MKRTFCYIIAVMTALSMTVHADARKNEGPKGEEGMVTYCLPSTVINLEVEAVQESFHAGPYAKFAEKYLGIKARQKDETTVQVTGIRLTPYVEPDQSRRYAVQVSKTEVNSNVFVLSNAGLVSFSDASFGDGVQWRFPLPSKSDFTGKGVSSNLTSESATLYGKSKKQTVSVQQNMVVEKSAEKKAAETADVIFRLRQKRLEIVTGDTDATYSGEAMGAALEELSRLEEEYMSLFVGYSDSQGMMMSFDLIPDGTAESQMYVAFRVSDTVGLLPADNLSGRPVVMEIVPQAFSVPQTDPVSEKNRTEPVIRYRLPAICTVKIVDGKSLLLQTRIPVYQLGPESSLPANISSLKTK
ncbi:MAG: DUF4831 family protein [Candidatus Cryptobacteroides sp.]